MPTSSNRDKGFKCEKCGHDKCSPVGPAPLPVAQVLADDQPYDLREYRRVRCDGCGDVSTF